MIQAILFDLDGTLLDSVTDLTLAVNAMLKGEGYPARSEDEIKSFIGNGAELLVERALPGSHKQRAAELLPVFRGYYDAHRAHTKPFAGIPELLRELRLRGIKTAVVSNKYDGAVAQIAATDFTGLIDIAVGGTDTRPLKPAPDMVNHVLTALKVPANNALYLGDMDIDVLTAHNAGLRFIGVTWGCHPAARLLAAGATQLIKTPAELITLL